MEIAWKEVSCIKGRYLQTTPISLQIILGLPKIHSKTGYINIEIRLGTRAKIILRNYQSMSELRIKGIPTGNLKFTWSILDHATAHINGADRCNLCLTEKFHIITSQAKLLNKKSELIPKCRHENKYYLSNYKNIPPDIP